jgi:hypothetical protein
MINRGRSLSFHRSRLGEGISSEVIKAVFRNVDQQTRCR